MGREFDIHISRSSIELHNIDRILDFLNELNNIKNFKEFFESWEIEEFEGNIEETVYELPYHNDGHLGVDQVEELVKEVIVICLKYDCIVNMTLKVFEDGVILTYWIIRDNIINNITSEINNVIRAKENEILGRV